MNLTFPSVLSAIFISWTLAAHSAVASPECMEEELPNQGHACYYLGTGAMSGKLMYYFHGVSGNQHDWETKYIPRGLQKQWEQMGVGTPAVISISFGRFWLATSSGNYGFRGKLPGLSPSEFKKLETRFKVENTQERWIYGDSMGGHTVWELAIRYPEFFSKVATTCSAQMSVSPFQYPYQYGSYAIQSGGWVSWILAASALFRSFYETEALWQQDSPLALMTDFIPPTSTRYLVMTVTNDVYGFTLPNRTLYETLLSKGAQVDYVEAKASHCSPPVEPLAKFLANKPGPEGPGERRWGRGYHPAPLSDGELPRTEGRGFPRLDE